MNTRTEVHPSIGLSHAEADERLDAGLSLDPYDRETDCRRHMIVHEERDLVLRTACKRKGCPECGAKLQAILIGQTIDVLEDTVYFGVVDADAVSPVLEKHKKRHQRGTQEMPRYQIVTDHFGTATVMSDVPMFPEQVRSALRKVLGIFLKVWRWRFSKLRRSRVFGTLSLVARSAISEGLKGLSRRVREAIGDITKSVAGWAFVPASVRSIDAQRSYLKQALSDDLGRIADLEFFGRIDEYEARWEKEDEESQSLRARNQATKPKGDRQVRFSLTR